MKRIVRLTESELVKLVRKVVNEGVFPKEPAKPWRDINVTPGKMITFIEDGKKVLVTSTDGVVDSTEGTFNEFTILQNPKQVPIDSSLRRIKIASFDNAKKMATLDNGLMIGPA